MSILQISFGPMINSVGGVERVFTSLANELGESYHMVSVYNDPQCGFPYYPVTHPEQLVNLNGSGDVFSAPLRIHLQDRWQRFRHKGAWRPTDAYRLHVASRRLQEVLQRVDPAVVLCHDMRALLALSIAGFPLRRVVQLFHSNAPCLLGQAMPQELALLREVGYIQVLRERDIQAVRAYSQSPCIVIGKAVPQVDVLETEEFRQVIYVGRIHPDTKRPHVILDSWERIHQEFPRWSLHMVGNLREYPAYVDRMRRRIHMTTMDGTVTFWGRSHHVDRHYLKASILAMPSPSEGFPLALTEAMAYGVPALGFASAEGVNDIIQHEKNGLLATSEADFTACLKRLMQDADLRHRLGKQAREDMKQYAPERIYQRWRDVIEDMASQLSLSERCQ